MARARDKTVGDVVRELKPAHLWGVLVALCAAFSGVFWWGCRYSDRANSGQIAALQIKLDNIMKYDIPSLSEGKLAVPCPRKQYEIVKLYRELSEAVNAADGNRILGLYHERYDNKGMSRRDVLKLYKPYMGQDIIFEVSSLKIVGDDTVAAKVTGFVQRDNYIDSYDTLVREGSGWRFIH